MGAFKWKALGLEYQLADTNPPTPEQVKAALDIFRHAGCNAR